MCLDPSAHVNSLDVGKNHLICCLLQPHKHHCSVDPVPHRAGKEKVIHSFSLSLAAAPRRSPAADGSGAGAGTVPPGWAPPGPDTAVERLPAGPRCLGLPAPGPFPPGLARAQAPPPPRRPRRLRRETRPAPAPPPR